MLDTDRIGYMPPTGEFIPLLYSVIKLGTAATENINFQFPVEARSCTSHAGTKAK